MINKPINKIEIDDIDNLISDSVPEGRTIDYKRDIPGGTDQDKKEFLADVSSFSNTSGGDLVFGLNEKNGIPVDIVGIDTPNIDNEVLRLENLIRDGIEPRITVETQIVKNPNGNPLLVLRMEKSWLSPHRVIFKNHDKFYSRNSAGKYPIDTSELRTAFLQSQTVSEKVNSFIKERLTEISSNNTPILMNDGPKIILHLIPFEFINPNLRLTTDLMIEQNMAMRPIRSSGWNWQINFDGYMTYSGREGGTSRSYVEFYRNSIFEAVDYFSDSETNNEKTIPMTYYEKAIIDCVERLFGVYKNIGIKPPIGIVLSFTGIKDYKINGDFRFSDGGHQYNRMTLSPPAVVVEDIEAKPEQILRPVFDLIWNSFGYEKSPNYDKNNNLITIR